MIRSRITSRSFTSTTKLFSHQRSKMFVPTLRENPAEATVPSHRLLLRAGFIRQMDQTAGLYMTLPLGLRVLDKIERLVDLAMAKCGGNKLAMPLLLPSSLWKRTGRWQTAGDELIRVQDRKGADYCLAPTHEEAFTELVASSIKSWRQLDDGGVRLYQTGKKYRDEVRPRFGLMRSREFIMKDMYSFDLDETNAIQTYNEVSLSYNALCHAIFGQEGKGWSRVEADTGNIGGSLSHEYQVHAEIGEDLLLHCNQCHHSANQEKMSVVTVEEREEGTKEKDKVHVWHGTNNEGNNVRIHISGVPKGRTVNPLKVQSMLQLIEEPKESARTKGHDDEGEAHGEAKAEGEGAEQDQPSTLVHGSTTCIGEDSSPTKIDVLQAMPNDTCPSCLSNTLTGTRGIEIGHVFYLGDKYSKCMEATYQNKNGRESLCDMGCYGIGISRIAAAAIERTQGHDENGIVWPEAIAPYRLCILPIGGGKTVANEYLNTKAMELCTMFEQKNIMDSDDIVVDDRSNKTSSPGIKLKEASLIGFPWIIVLGKDSLPSNKEDWKNEMKLEEYLLQGGSDGGGTVEIQERATGISVHVPFSEVVEYFQNHARCRTPVELLMDGFDTYEKKERD